MLITEDPWVIVATIAAVTAALTGAISLLAIKDQIKLARHEISLVQDDLDNSRKALEYAKEQSEVVRRQDESANRKAHLELYLNEYNSDSFGAYLSMYVLNAGHRTATAFKVHLYCKDGSVLPGVSIRDQWNITNSKLLAPFASSFSKDYVVNCYVGYRTELPKMRLDLNRDGGQSGLELSTLAYRLIYEDGFTPSPTELLPLRIRRPDLESPPVANQ